MFTGSEENEGILEIGNSTCTVVELTKSLASVENCKWFALAGMLAIAGGNQR